MIAHVIYRGSTFDSVFSFSCHIVRWMDSTNRPVAAKMFSQNYVCYVENLILLVLMIVLKFIFIYLMFYTLFY